MAFRQNHASIFVHTAKWRATYNFLLAPHPINKVGTRVSIVEKTVIHPYNRDWTLRPYLKCVIFYL